MNRIGEMKAYLETEKEAFLQKRLSEMAQACSKSCGESGKDLCCVMERLALREGGVFGISFLRSSYITGNMFSMLPTIWMTRLWKRPRRLSAFL